MNTFTLHYILSLCKAIKLQCLTTLFIKLLYKLSCIPCIPCILTYLYTWPFTHKQQTLTTDSLFLFTAFLLSHFTKFIVLHTLLACPAHPRSPVFLLPCCLALSGFIIHTLCAYFYTLRAARATARDSSGNDDMPRHARQTDF